MSRICHLMAGAATLLIAQGVASAQDRVRTVEQYTCKDVMREHGADRDVVIAFLHGVILGKSGNSRVDLAVLRKHSSDFIERCLDNPGERAIDAMMKVKG